MAVVAVGAVFLIRTFLVQPFLVSGASMVPNFEDKDYLLIDQLTYRFREPARGEVVVFRYPNNPSTYFIKRVVGLPGDRVVLDDNKITIFNKQHPQGKVLDENYIPLRVTTNPRPGGQSQFVLTDGEYLVLGDNRTFSFDSRDWGILPRTDIIGLARLRLWPPTNLKVFASASDVF